MTSTSYPLHQPYQQILAVNPNAGYSSVHQDEAPAAQAMYDPYFPWMTTNDGPQAKSYRIYSVPDVSSMVLQQVKEERISSSSSSMSEKDEKKEDSDVAAAYLRRRNSINNSRPHKCNFCSRIFSRRHDRERHMRLHTGVKPYVCPCCLKAFPRSDARRRHFRNEVACREGPQILAFIKNQIRSTI